jgi:methylornithine synthase
MEGTAAVHIGPAAEGADFPLTEETLRELLTGGEAARLSLFAEARRVRAAVFDRRIFLYGFVYFSTYCRNNCHFCYYRRDQDIDRYRKSEDEVVETAVQLATSGVHLIDLTMGEDPLYHAEGFRSVFSIIRRIRRETGLPVMISPGLVPIHIILAFAEAGANFFALYQETHNRALFAGLRAEQDFDKRMQCKVEAKLAGMRIEEGLLAGVGEGVADLIHSLREMGRIGANQMRVMSFVPQVGTPMAARGSGERKEELVLIALMRLLYPHALIPASLDVDGLAGLRDRLNAGANVVTSIIPPRAGYKGVAQSDLDVDAGGRTVAEVQSVLAELGLKDGLAEGYQNWLALSS